MRRGTRENTGVKRGCVNARPPRHLPGVGLCDIARYRNLAWRRRMGELPGRHYQGDQSPEHHAAASGACPCPHYPESGSRRRTVRTGNGTGQCVSMAVSKAVSVLCRSSRDPCNPLLQPPDRNLTVRSEFAGNCRISVSLVFHPRSRHGTSTPAPLVYPEMLHSTSLGICCGQDYVAESRHGRAGPEDPPHPRNITSFDYSAPRNAISPLFSFHGRTGPGSAASHSAIALAFISRSISA